MTKGKLYKTGDTVVTRKGNKYIINGIEIEGVCYSATNTNNGIMYSVGFSIIDHEATAKLNTPSPKSLIKDGWMGKNKIGASVYFMPSIDIYIFVGVIYSIEHFDDNLIYGNGKDDRLCIMELYDNLGNLQWKREEKSAKDIEIERIESEIRTSSEEYAKTVSKLMDDLSKLKGNA